MSSRHALAHARSLQALRSATDTPNDTWTDAEGHAESDLDYLRAHPSAALPPSPYSPGSLAQQNRPHAPTPLGTTNSSVGVEGAVWSPVSDPGPHFSYYTPIKSSSPHTPSSPVMHAAGHPASGLRSEQQLFPHSGEDGSNGGETSPPHHALKRSPTMPALPDPSQFPDPYPYRVPQHQLRSPPSLVSSGVSSARSSAYTSFGSAAFTQGSDSVRVYSMSDEAELPGSGGASSGLPEALQRMRLQPSKKSLNAPATPPRDHPPGSNPRWSMSSVGSAHSRASSMNDARGKSTFDTAWASLHDDHLTSDAETDDEDEDVELNLDDDEDADHRTAAIVIAEEGRGLIVRGDDRPIVQLEVQPGTTHLLIGSSSTPNAVPSFLALNLPQTSHSLLALDISANFLGALPPALSSCVHLEELNIASNPLRVLPIFLANLISLRVLIADSTGIAVLPPPLSALDKLHTLSIRRNKLNSLPAWFSLLPSLQTLLVDGNPFQGPWKMLVDPILSKEVTTPLYTPATHSPFAPLSAVSSVHPPSAIVSSIPNDDAEELSDGPSGASESLRPRPDEEDTIMPPRAPPVQRTVTAPFLGRASNEADDTASIRSTTPSVTRRKTTGSRSHGRQRADSKSKVSPALPRPQRAPSPQLRKMKSAGELHRDAINTSSQFLAPATPQRPSLTHYATSDVGVPESLAANGDPVRLPPRFASLGAASIRDRPHSRAHVDQSIWDNISGDEASGDSIPPSPMPPPSPIPPVPALPERIDSHHRARSREHKEDKDKSKWGFLKKMSMARIKSDPPPLPSRGSPPQARSSSRSALSRPRNATTSSAYPPDHSRKNEPPKLDIRMSAMNPLDLVPPTVQTPPAQQVLQQPTFEVQLSRQPSLDKSRLGPTTSIASAEGLLVPTGPTPRASKRRSFLPIDGPTALSIPIPPPSPSIQEISVTNGTDEADTIRTPSPGVDPAERQAWLTQERQREVYARALRAVMAYLRDMHDLSLPQNPTGADPSGGLRSRRPTVVDRTASEHSMASSMTSIGSDGSKASVVSPTSMYGGQLRSPESIAAIRSGTSSHTVSVATTDSNGSGGVEERKFKDDKGKRAMIIREIVETERTYVKQLQELVDIYIRSASVPVSNITTSSKETVVPAAERKIVFGGLESLFSFHKESFLPALENVAAPLMKPSAELAQVDADGRLSVNVTTNVANMFVSQAAFMRMYSTYINNFDNSVQRIKSWSSDRPVPAPTSSTLTSPSTTQLAGIGLAMSAVSSPGVTPEGAGSPQLRLSSGQRKRIKAWLKRCRINPRHSQLNLEGYLLLPVQRIPRYKLLLEQLLSSTPPTGGYVEDPLDRALGEIASLANNMNEGKREAEGRTKLVKWQARIRGSSKFPSPLVQPHRRLIMDGPLRLTRVVRKTSMTYEIVTAQGDSSTVQVDCLAPEHTPRSLTGVLCNDLLVLCRDPSEGRDPTAAVDLWAVLRMQTVPQPASIVHGNVLRIVDNKAVLYFDAPSASEALNWYRAININIPTSKA